MEEVCLTVGVLGDLGDKRAYSKLICSQAVAQHIELSFSRELEKVGLILVLVALDVELGEFNG